MKIYQAKKIETIKEIGEILHAQLEPEIGQDLEYVVEDFIHFWKDNKEGIIYVMKDGEEFLGTIGGFPISNVYNKKDKQVLISFFYVLPIHRNKKSKVSLKLYNLFEKWCVNRKIIAASSTKTAKNFYRKRGFKEIETTWLKGLNKNV